MWLTVGMAVPAAAQQGALAPRVVRGRLAKVTAAAIAAAITPAVVVALVVPEETLVPLLLVLLAQAQQYLAPHTRLALLVCWLAEQQEARALRTRATEAGLVGAQGQTAQVAARALSLFGMRSRKTLWPTLHKWTTAAPSCK